MKVRSLWSAIMLSTAKYLDRLRLDRTLGDDAHPSLAKLRQLQESHLAHIPFENLAQHGCAMEASLDVEATATKILERQRGGFCFELNTLFGTLLRQLGYHVNFVLAHVHTPDGYRDKPSHVVLVVTCRDGGGNGQDTTTATTTTHLVDVGFGEPALHPLNYTAWGVEQETPEGMKSKIVRDGDDIELYWFKEGSWQPRLKWSFEQSQTGVELRDMKSGLASVLGPDSIFSKKLITTRLTRTTKLTLAGSRYKLTGPPRFQPDGSQGPKKTKPLGSVADVQAYLQQQYGIPVSETQGLCLETSNDPEHEAVWSQF